MPQATRAAEEEIEDDEPEIAISRKKGAPVNPNLLRLWGIVDGAITGGNYRGLAELAELPSGLRIEGYKFAALWAGRDADFETRAVADFVREVESLKGLGRRADAYENALKLTGRRYGELLAQTCKTHIAEILEEQRPKPREEFTPPPEKKPCAAMKKEPPPVVAAAPAAAKQRRGGLAKRPVFVVAANGAIVKRRPGRPPRNQRLIAAPVSYEAV